MMVGIGKFVKIDTTLEFDAVIIYKHIIVAHCLRLFRVILLLSTQRWYDTKSMSLILIVIYYGRETDMYDF